MNTNGIKLSAVVLFVLFFVGTASVSAQYGKGWKSGDDIDYPGNRMEPRWLDDIPDLTEAQKTQIGELRTAHLAKMIEFKAKLEEKKAALRTLEVSSNPSTEKIDAAIEEISEIKENMMKSRAAHRQAIRKLLTDEQRVYFDASAQKEGKKGKGMKRGGCRF